MRSMCCRPHHVPISKFECLQPTVHRVVGLNEQYNPFSRSPRPGADACKAASLQNAGGQRYTRFAAPCGDVRGVMMRGEGCATS